MILFFIGIAGAFFITCSSSSFSPTILHAKKRWILPNCGFSCQRTGKYCDVPLGLYVVRGDSIVLMGEIDSDREVQMKLEKLTPREFAELPEANPEKIDWDFEG